MQLLRRFLEGSNINPLNSELYPISHLLALLGAHPILHVSRISANHGCQSWKEDCFLVESYFLYFSFVPAELTHRGSLAREKKRAA
jgi:hypothetical protein